MSSINEYGGECNIKCHKKLSPEASLEAKPSDDWTMAGLFGRFYLLKLLLMKL